MGQGEAWWLEPMVGGGRLRWWVAVAGRHNGQKVAQSPSCTKQSKIVLGHVAASFGSCGGCPWW